jgi:hypothetical protein
MLDRFVRGARAANDLGLATADWMPAVKRLLMAMRWISGDPARLVRRAPL